MSYFHYTSIESLFHIVNSSAVWFGSLAFMNDEMEGIELHKILSEVLGEKYGTEKCKSTLELVDSTIDVFLRFQMSFSASSLKDDISQWRAYTDIGAGICIEFEDGFLPSDSTKIDCVYDFKAKKKSIIENKKLKVNDLSIDSILSQENGAVDFANSVVETLLYFKNKSFSPEQETRWVYSLDGANDPRLKFRPHRLGLTTYMEVPVDLSKVKSITIGPQVLAQNKKTIEDFVIINECSGYLATSAVTLR